MITIIERKSYTGHQITSGTDFVVCSMPIPPGGVLLGYRAEIHAITSTHKTAITSACALFGKAVVVRTGGSMMDASLSLQTIWDQMVPKDVDLDIAAGGDDIDWDDGAIAGPFEEPGHINFNDMVELGQRPTALQEKEVMISPASPQAKMFHVDTTDEYFPTARMTMGKNLKHRARDASYFLLALGSPSWDETTTTEPSTIANQEWSLLTYPDVMFDMMLPDLLGMTEAGAESPFSEAASQAVSFVEPPVFELAAGALWQATSWNVWVKWSVRIATPGRPKMRALKGGIPG